MTWGDSGVAGRRGVSEGASFDLSAAGVCAGALSIAVGLAASALQGFKLTSDAVLDRLPAFALLLF